MGTLNDRMLDETLSNNTNSDLCRQCKECRLQSDGTPWSNEYTKLHCAVYTRPMHKPDNVVYNESPCSFREVKNG